jgi:acetylornithine/N-succinyldiaminopimelate aminotransferase
VTRTEELATRWSAVMMSNYKTPPVALARGAGATVWDVDGREYTDLLGGIATTILGHAHPKVVEAISTQAAKLGHVSNLAMHEPGLALAERLLELAGRPGRVFFCNSGAEANEAALKVARKATGRARVVALEGGFHGRTLGALSATGQPAKWEGFGPLVPGFAFARPNDVESLEAAVSPGGELAAIMLEPVLGEGGVVPLDDAFVAAAAEIARELGALLVVDEVQTGLGRTGTFFAYEQLGLRPDLVTLAKGLANGLPVGALLVRDGAPEAFKVGDHGSTFGGNPVVCAAACAVVETLDDVLLASVRARGAELGAGLAVLPGVLDVRGRGLMLGAELDRPAGPVVAAALEAGLLVGSAGDTVLRLTPPLTISAWEIATGLTKLEEVLT